MSTLTPEHESHVRELVQQEIDRFAGLVIAEVGVAVQRYGSSGGQMNDAITAVTGSLVIALERFEQGDTP